MHNPRETITRLRITGFNLPAPIAHEGLDTKPSPWSTASGNPLESSRDGLSEHGGHTSGMRKQIPFGCVFQNQIVFFNKAPKENGKSTGYLSWISSVFILYLTFFPFHRFLWMFQPSFHIFCIGDCSCFSWFPLKFCTGNWCVQLKLIHSHMPNL